MEKDRKIIVCFAGCVGSSKSPIAYYLSCKFGLPIFNNDGIRTEVIEDLNRLDEEEQKKRRDERLNWLIKNNKSFILDASIDRSWNTMSQEINCLDYQIFIISLDITKELLTRLYKAKGYHESLLVLDRLIEDHNLFLKEYGHLVNLSISDSNFVDRLKLSEEAFGQWVDELPC